MDICNMLKLPEYIQEIIWNVIKSMLSCEPQILINRHLDQLVMCAIYSVCKISDFKQISFNKIINMYSNLFMNKSYVTSIYSNCVIN